jgi:hypothetical protein
VYSPRFITNWTLTSYVFNRLWHDTCHATANALQAPLGNKCIVSVCN